MLARLACSFVLLGMLSAQDFDVAVIRRIDPSAAATIASGKIDSSHGRLYMRAVTMAWAIRWAYDLRTWQLEGPGWLNWTPGTTDRFDIRAQTETPLDVKPMLKKLLKDRMGLKFHTESREKQAYSLSVDRGGLKLTESKSDGDGAFTFTGRKATIKNMTIGDLCDDLSQTFRTPLIDETDLGDKRFDGSFVFEVSLRESYTPDLIAAIKKDLGLTIRYKTAKITMMVVDEILKAPSEEK